MEGGVLIDAGSIPKQGIELARESIRDQKIMKAIVVGILPQERIRDVLAILDRINALAEAAGATTLGFHLQKNYQLICRCLRIAGGFTAPAVRVELVGLVPIARARSASIPSAFSGEISGRRSWINRGLASLANIRCSATARVIDCRSCSR